MAMTETQGWTREQPGVYRKRIGAADYEIRRDDRIINGRVCQPYDVYRNGDLVDEDWKRLSDAKRAAHRHAEGGG